MSTAPPTAPPIANPALALINLRLTHCPLCSRPLPDRWLRKNPRRISINRIIVCRKCLYGFANRRQAAYFIDATLLYVVKELVFYGYIYVWPPGSSQIADPAGFNPTDWLVAISVFSSLVVFPLLFCFKDGFGGQSPGKALCGVQVVDRDTYRPGAFRHSFKRNLCLVVPYIVPVIVAFTLTKGWRLGDDWARTRVIWRKYAYKPPFVQRGILCTACGYDLTGNVSGRCPECGTDIPKSAPVGGIPTTISRFTA